MIVICKIAKERVHRIHLNNEVITRVDNYFNVKIGSTFCTKYLTSRLL